MSIFPDRDGEPAVPDPLDTANDAHEELDYIGPLYGSSPWLDRIVTAGMLIGGGIILALIITGIWGGTW